tara:strand:+ start:337 stop:639 length:303 start_codon:yes stop_codon:yes gene_type:complete
VRDENKRTGGLWRLIAKGGELVAFKKNVIVTQRCFRTKALFVNSQVQHINNQWQLKEDALFDDLVRKQHDKEVVLLIPANAEVGERAGERAGRRRVEDVS